MGEANSAPEAPSEESPRARARRLAGVAAALVLVVGSTTLEVMSAGNLPWLDAVLGLVLLGAGVAVIAAIDQAFVLLRRRGRIWSGRIASLVLTFVSVWALVRAVQYDNAHHYADGKATNLGQALMGVAFAGVVAGLIGVGISWRRLRSHNEDAEPPKVSRRWQQTKPGFPRDGAEPPFEFRSPWRSVWHCVVLPVVLVVLLVLIAVSLYVRSADPILGGVVVLYLVSLFVLPVIPPIYWRCLVVGHDGLRVTRMGTDRFIPWHELRDVQLEADPDSQDYKTRMRLVSTRGSYVSDVPKALADEMNLWREFVLAARPLEVALPPDEDTLKPSVLRRLADAARVRRRGLLLLLVWSLLASPVLVNMVVTRD